MNGKTTLLKKVIEDGGHYISEGPIIIDIKITRFFPVQILKKGSDNKQGTVCVN